MLDTQSIVKKYMTPKGRLNLLLGLLLLDLGDTLSLLGESLGSSFSHGLVLDSSGLGLFLEVLGSELLGFGLVDVLHQDSLVLESVTLGLEVESVVADVSGGGAESNDSSTYRCLSIFPPSLYFFNNRRRTRIRRSHWTLVGIRASEVPLRLPVPVCRPSRLAAWCSLVRAREWMVVGLMMLRGELG